MLINGQSLPFGESFCYSHVFCLSQPVDHYPLCVFDVFDDNALILQCLMLHPSFCSLKKGNPSLLFATKGPKNTESCNFSLSVLLAWCSLLCLLSCGVFGEDREWFNEIYPKFLPDRSSSRKWKWQFHCWCWEMKPNKWNENETLKSLIKKKSSYYQRNSWVLESGSSLISVNV